MSVYFLWVEIIFQRILRSDFKRVNGNNFTGYQLPLLKQGNKESEGRLKRLGVIFPKIGNFTSTGPKSSEQPNDFKVNRTSMRQFPRGTYPVLIAIQIQLE